MVNKIYTIELKIIIKYFFWLNHYLKVDNIGCKLYNYILFLTKRLKIKIKIRVFILNFIIGK